MSKRSPMVGLALYHATDLTARPELLDLLLATANAVAGKERLAYVRGQFRASDRFSRQQKVRNATLEQLKTDLRENVFQALQFDALPASQQEESEGYASLELNLKAARSPKVDSREVAVCPYRLYMLVPRAAPGQLLDCLNQFVLALNAPYAFVHLGSDFGDALMEVVATPIVQWGHELSSREVRRHSRLSRCQAERVRIGTIACGAYWGNVLSEEMVNRLGGRERVKQEAPVAIVSELASGQLYLQLTPDLPDPVADSYQTALDSLENYLTPVIVIGQRGESV